MNKIYENDSYISKYDTIVTDCMRTSDGVFIQIKDSIFFPEEGGQYADTGYIEADSIRYRLSDGQIINNKKRTDSKSPDFFRELPDGIWYRIDPVAPSKSPVDATHAIYDALVIKPEIHCILDNNMRYDRMQNHTGEHILTGIVHNDYGYNNVGFHLSDDGPVTLDLDGPLSYEQIIEEEAKANAIIYANLPVRASYPSKEELKDIEYRSKIDIEGQVRLITIGDDKTTVDTCACCAPHVAYTGEVGIIKVISIVNWRGGVRIGILCGRRALEYINHRQRIIMGLTALMTTDEDNLIDRMSDRMDEIKALKAKLSNALEADIVSRIHKGDPDIDRTHLVFVDHDFPAGPMKNIYNLLKNRYAGYVGIFAGDDVSGYRYLAGSRNIDSTTLIPILGKLSAKGGGSPDMIQGRIPATRSRIETAFANISQI